MKKVKVKITVEDGVIYVPQYQTLLATGADVFPLMKKNETYTLQPGERKLFVTGIKMEIPDGYEIQVRPRSGLAIKKGVTIVNAPGSLDADYRGDVGVILINHGSESVEISRDTAIAQLVLAESIQAEYEVVNEPLSKTDRGEGGFGHTGNGAK